ncbi:MAG: glycosyltransferase family 4 protein, partial [Acidobacteria bacterium]|nr:glycosyltransferase family 4 protein [Acidobacteriota bacterium]
RVGGLNRYLASLDQALVRTGMCSASQVVAIGDSTSPTHTGVNGSTWWRRWSEVRRAVKHSPAAIIDVHFPAHVVWALVTGALRDRPMVVHFQGPWYLESRWTGSSAAAAWLKKRIEGYVLRRADAVIVLSRAFRDVVVNEFRVQPRRVTVLAPGVEVHSRQESSATRATRGIPHDVPLIVSVRRLVPRMGLDVVIWALAEPELREAHFVVVGSGPSLVELQQLAGDLGVESRVHFVGVVTDEERDAWLTTANVSVVPSVALEGFGLAALESLACGTPVVASDLGGLRDLALWTPHVTLATPTIVREWADALVSVVERGIDPADVARSVANWTWDDVATWTVRAVYGPLVQGALREQLQVVVLDHSAQSSGGELALVRTLESLGTTGEFSAHVILFENGPLEVECARRSISYEVLPLAPRTQHRRKDALHHGVLASLWDSLIFSLRLRRRLHQLRPAVVHTNSLKAFVVGSVVSVMAPWRLVSHVRDLWSPPYLSRGIARTLRLLATLRSDLVIANSRVTAAAVTTDAIVIPSPVEERLRLLSDPVHDATLRVGLIGRLAPWKGQDLFLDALDLIADVPYEAVIVGDALFGETSYRDNLHQRVASMDGRVRMLGHVDDISDVMRNLDVVVLASRSPEPFGNVVTEAMASGRLVVVPRQGGVMDFVSDRVNGLYYEPNNESSLADVLRAIALGRVDRVQLGSAARETAEQFVGPVVSERLRAAYRFVLK